MLDPQAIAHIVLVGTYDRSDAGEVYWGTLLVELARVARVVRARRPGVGHAGKKDRVSVPRGGRLLWLESTRRPGRWRQDLAERCILNAPCFILVHRGSAGVQRLNHVRVAAACAWEREVNHAVSESETIWAVEPCEHSIGPRDRDERVRVPRAISKPQRPTLGRPSCGSSRRRV